jgi:glycosyltransferase involved in cell wall biosynthesis
MPRALYAWVARRLDAAVLVSESQRAYFEELLPADRVYVVPHGVDTTFFAPAEQRTRDGGPICITVGSHLRDFATLRAAMPLVWAKEPSVRFVLVGSRRSRHASLTRVDDPRVRLVDGVSDDELLRAYRSASAAVLPLLDATTSVSLLEAMACGLPVVATRVGGIPEYADGAAALCPPRDARALGEAVLSVLSDAGEAERLGAAACARASELDYRAVARRHLAVYENL